MSRHRRQQHKRARKRLARILKAQRAMKKFASILSDVMSKHRDELLYDKALFPGLTYKQ